MRLPLGALVVQHQGAVERGLLRSGSMCGTSVAWFRYATTRARQSREGGLRLEPGGTARMQKGNPVQAVKSGQRNATGRLRKHAQAELLFRYGKAPLRSETHQKHTGDSRVTGPKEVTPLCSCDVLPWEDCEHTANDDAESIAILRTLK
jgi:hypothetical protein